jgi:uncharacterized protein (TIRG00374 family)
LKFLRASLKIILPLGIGVLFIFLTFNTTTPEERELIYGYIRNVDLRFVLLSLLFGILSHVSRAYRWKFMLAHLGYRPKFINSVLAVLIAYIANLGIPRSGELLRATTLSTYEDIPFEKGFGTIIAERLVDLVILLLFILIALGLQYDLIMGALALETISLPKIFLLGSVLILLFIGLRFLFKKSQKPWVLKIKSKVQGLIEGILSIKNMPKKGAFIAHTLFIWIMYLAMFYVIKWTVPETAVLGLGAILPAFVIGGLTISATNGGIGIYPFSVALMLSAFDISNESGLAFGWIMWTSQTAMIILFGGLAFFALPLVNRKK